MLGQAILGHRRSLTLWLRPPARDESNVSINCEASQWTFVKLQLWTYGFTASPNQGLSQLGAKLRPGQSICISNEARDCSFFLKHSLALSQCQGHAAHPMSNAMLPSQLVIVAIFHVFPHMLLCW